MILILSAAYIDQSIQAEFGLLPPAFLPVGNKKLIEYQVESLRKIFGNEVITLSLPLRFTLTPNEKAKLSELGLEIIQVDEMISLGESLYRIISHPDFLSETLYLLHGDTLLETYFINPNGIGIKKARDAYQWQVENFDETGETIWCGYFSFNNVPQLVNCIREAGCDFVKALYLYDNITRLDRVTIDEWYDFGHLNTFYTSRTKFNTQRYFNTISVENGVMKKKGGFDNKILAEANWFTNIPPELKIYTPSLIEVGYDGKDEFYYSLEYLYLPPLNELFVHCRNPLFVWNKIFDHVCQYFKLCTDTFHKRRPAEIDISLLKKESGNMIRAKTKKRLYEFQKQTNINLNLSTTLNGIKLPSINQICEICIDKSLHNPIIIGYLHGDLCLSNMLYDFRSDRLKLVDPRGINSRNELSIFGNLIYDLAKLAHSIIGLYDHIIAGEYKFNESTILDFSLEIYVNERILEIQELFLRKYFFPGVMAESILPQVVLLFLSMLPLHSDNAQRQKALLANALRVFQMVQQEGR